MRRLALGLLAVAMGGLATAHAQGPGKWVKLAPFPEPADTEADTRPNVVRAVEELGLLADD